MDSLPTIPTPLPQLWREIRIRIMPVATFTCVIAALFLMWREYVMPASIIGQAEVIQANIIAKSDGMLTKLSVEQFDNVTKDQNIGVLTPMDDELTKASLATIASEMRLAQKELETDVARNQDAIARLRAELASERKNYANLEVQLVGANYQWEAQQKLFKMDTNAVSPAQLKVYEITAQSTKVQKEKSLEMIAQLEKDIAALEKSGSVQTAENDPIIMQLMKDKEAEVLALAKPVDLIVPIDGKISAVLKRPGERVRKGEAIATISAPTSGRVVGYIRQPIDRVPKAGDTAEVRTRTQRRVVLQGTIIHVGPSMVPLEPALLSADTRRREVGLPILISLPQNADPLVPGEFVDISLHYAKK